MTTRDRESQPENVSSPLLPGGDLIAATLNRQLMIWSDRGGASREIGNRWALRTNMALNEAIEGRWPVPKGSPFTLVDVIRLDDVPDVSNEANRMKLENPDFLLLGVRRSDDSAVLQAADAKFAADRIKPSQVSESVVTNLLDIPGGVTREIVRERAARRNLASPSVVRGVFVVPSSELTTYLLRRVTRGRNAVVDPEEVVHVTPEPATMFSGLPESQAIGALARIDALPVTPRSNLISAIYYFRLACACFHHWTEQQKPLLSDAQLSPPEPGIVVAEIAQRATIAPSAFELVSSWAVDVEPFVRAREAVANVASLPLRMRDIRARVERAGNGGEPRVLRTVRRDIELAFRRRLLDLTGDIHADDPRSLSTILDEVAKASRSLAAEMSVLLDQIIAAAVPPDTTRATEEAPAVQEYT